MVSKLESDIFSEPWRYADFLQILSDPKKYYYVALQDGEVLGYCGLFAVAWEGQIFNVAVKKEARQQGIGKGLLLKVMNQGIQLGLTEFTLEVRAGNQAAIALYQRFGFQIVGTRRDFYQKPVEDALLMTAIPTIQSEGKVLEYCCGGNEYGTEDGDTVHKVL